MDKLNEAVNVLQTTIERAQEARAEQERQGEEQERQIDEELKRSEVLGREWEEEFERQRKILEEMEALTRTTREFNEGPEMVQLQRMGDKLRELKAVAQTAKDELDTITIDLEQETRTMTEALDALKSLSRKMGESLDDTSN